MKKIHVGFLLSYDYEKLKTAIPLVYKHADHIFLAKDENNLTWSGNSYTIDQEFYDWLESFDELNKITIYSDNFYVPELDALQNDTRERTMLAEKMGIGNWIVQVDSDEFFIDFEGFVKTLRKYDRFLEQPEKNKVQIAIFHVNLYKYDDNGVFYITNPTRFVMATNYPNYKTARKTNERMIYAPHLVLHECLARDEASLQFKLDNWGHKKDMDNDRSFMEKWKATHISNYKEMKNLFYLNPERWKSLSYVKGHTIPDIIKNFDFEKITPSSFYIFKKSLGQYFKFLFR